jgi:hypothetical protein
LVSIVLSFCLLKRIEVKGANSSPIIHQIGHIIRNLRTRGKVNRLQRRFHRLRVKAHLNRIGQHRPRPGAKLHHAFLNVNQAEFNPRSQNRGVNACVDALAGRLDGRGKLGFGRCLAGLKVGGRGGWRCWRRRSCDIGRRGL